VRERIHAKNILILIVISYFFFIFGNSFLSLTDPDEVFYTQTAKEMVQHKTWMTPVLFDQPQFEKPIFTYWLLRLGFIFFGVTNFGARFFPAFFALLGVVAVYLLGVLGFRDNRKAFLSSLILASSGLYVGLARTVFTDMFFSVLILFSLVAFFWGYINRERKTLSFLLFFIFAGLAVLAKGPLGLLIVLATVLLFLIIQKNVRFILCREFLFGFLAFLLVALPWYIFMAKTYGAAFNQEFFYNDHWRRVIEAEHAKNDTWYFYPASAIGCMFPWSLFVLGALFFLKTRMTKGGLPLDSFLVSCVVSVLLIFQFAHSKLVSYIFPAIPALALITGNFVAENLKNKTMGRFFKIAVYVTLGILFLIPVVLWGAGSRFAHYISYKPSVYIMMVVSFLVFLAMLIFVLKKDIFKSLMALSGFLPLMFLTAVIAARPNFEPYVSSKYSGMYLNEQEGVEGAIVCTKFFARGVRFYTDRPVAILEVNGKQFFSPHPVAFLDTQQKAIEFLKQQPVTYAVLKKSVAGDLEKTLGPGFKNSVLNTFGNEVVVRIERM